MTGLCSLWLNNHWFPNCSIREERERLTFRMNNEKKSPNLKNILFLPRVSALSPQAPTSYILTKGNLVIETVGQFSLSENFFLKGRLPKRWFQEQWQNTLQMKGREGTSVNSISVLEYQSVRSTCLLVLKGKYILY